MVRTGAAIFANYWVNTGFVLATENYDPWLFYMLTDALTAWVIMLRPAGRPQSLIGWTFITQVMLHAVYGASKYINPEFNAYWAQIAYWKVLLSVALLQLVILGGWIGGHWWRRYTYRSGANSVAGPSSA